MQQETTLCHPKGLALKFLKICSFHQLGQLIAVESSHLIPYHCLFCPAKVVSPTCTNCQCIFLICQLPSPNCLNVLCQQVQIVSALSLFLSLSSLTFLRPGPTYLNSHCKCIFSSPSSPAIREAIIEKKTQRGGGGGIVGQFASSCGRIS